MAALKRGTDVFGIFTGSPVCGLRPVRAARAAFSKVPNPVIATLPPLLTSRTMASSTASSASVAALRLPRLASIDLMSSALFTFAPQVRLRRGPRQVDDQATLPGHPRR